MNSSKEIITAGDLNLADVNWVTGTVTGPVDSSNKEITVQKMFFDTICDHGLSWSITDEVTRRKVVDGELQESTLDQILCTNDSMVECIKLYAPLGKSDHVCIAADVCIDSGVNSEFICDEKQAWGKVNQEKIQNLSKDIRWNYTSPSLDVEAMWEEFHGKLMEITSQIPVKNNTNGQKTHVPWNSSSLKRKRKEKDRQWAFFNDNPTHTQLNIALSKQSEYEKKELDAMRKYETKLTSNLKHSNKSFFSYLRSKRSVNSTVTYLDKPDGSKTANATDTAGLLGDTFSSVFLNEPCGPLPEECYIRGDHITDIGEVNIDAQDVAEQLRKLNI